MLALKEDCIGCEQCLAYCPMKALSLENERIKLDYDLCVECGACVRNSGCPTDALKFEEEMQWPRVIRRLFSDPNFKHSNTTKGMGRGTAEMKSNDVTGRFRKNEAGIGVELGRPGTGVCFTDVEKVTRAVLGLGIKFEEKNPLINLMSDPAVGKFKEEVLNERVLSTIVEFCVPTSKLIDALELIKGLENEVDTVFSVFIVTRAEDDDSLPNIELLKQAGYELYPNNKINVGLGRPLA